MVVFGQDCCIRAKTSKVGQKLLYSGKIVALGIKWLNSGKSGCIRAKRNNSATKVVFVQVCCFREMWFNSGKNCCIGAKGVVLRQKLL